MGRHNTLPFSLIRSTVTASVRRPKGGGRSRLGPPTLNPPLTPVDHRLSYDEFL